MWLLVYICSIFYFLLKIKNKKLNRLRPGGVSTPRMPSMIVGSNEYAAHFQTLRNKGQWPPRGDERAPPLPMSQEKNPVIKAKKYRGRKVKCSMMCCQTNQDPAVPSESIPQPDAPPEYVGWTKVGKNGRTICRPSEYLTDDCEDLLQ